MYVSEKGYIDGVACNGCNCEYKYTTFKKTFFIKYLFRAMELVKDYEI